MREDPFELIMREQAEIDRTVERARLKETPIFDKGSYTPTYLGGTTPGTTTYAFAVALYWILGSYILVTGQINWTAATGTGEARVSLPIAPISSNWSGSLRLAGVTFASGTPQILISSGNLYFVMDSPLTNAAGTRVAMEAVGSVIWTVIYAIR